MVASAMSVVPLEVMKGLARPYEDGWFGVEVLVPLTHPEENHVRGLIAVSGAEAGQIAWVDAHKGEWADVLRRALPPDTKVEVTIKLGHQGFTVQEAWLKASIGLSGNIHWRDIEDKEVQKALGHDVARIICARISDLCPPPFATNPPLFAAGQLDTFRVYLIESQYGDHRYWKDYPDRAIWFTGHAGDFIAELVERYGANYQGRSLSPDPYTEYGEIFLRWKQDVSNKERGELRRMINRVRGMEKFIVTVGPY